MSGVQLLELGRAVVARLGRLVQLLLALVEALGAPVLRHPRLFGGLDGTLAGRARSLARGIGALAGLLGGRVVVALGWHGVGRSYSAPSGRFSISTIAPRTRVPSPGTGPTSGRTVAAHMT